MQAVVFPAWARFALGLILAFASYLTSGELHVDEELRAGLATLLLVFSTAGVVPPSPASVPAFLQDARVRFVLLLALAVGAWVINVVDVEPIVRGIVAAALSTFGSIGIIPPQAAAPSRRDDIGGDIPTVPPGLR